MYQEQLMIVEIEADEQGRHGLQTQSGRSACWLEGWVAVPKELAQTAWESGGYCDLTLSDGVLTAVTVREKPAVEPEEPVPTETERLRADVDYLAAMTGVIL